MLKIHWSRRKAVDNEFIIAGSEGELKMDLRGEKMKKLYLLLLVTSMSLIGCDQENDSNNNKNIVNSSTVPEPATCEAIVMEDDCRLAGCSWTIAKSGAITDGLCVMEEAWTHRCLSIVPGTEQNVPVGYYRVTESGYLVIVIDDKGENLLGWSRCDSHEGWSQDCSGCDL